MGKLKGLVFQAKPSDESLGYFQLPLRGTQRPCEYRAMLTFEGDQDFSQPPDEVWSKLANPQFLVRCIPDVQSVARAGPDEAVFSLRPGFSFVRGTLQITLQVVEANKPVSARLRANSKGIGTSSDVEAILELGPHNAGTRVHWVAEVKQLGGLLKAVPQGLIKASAQKVIADIWSAIAANFQT